MVNIIQGMVTKSKLGNFLNINNENFDTECYNNVTINKVSFK